MNGLSIAALILASVAAGLMGPLTVVRKATYAAGAISHGVFAGIGLAVLLATKLGMTAACDGAPALPGVLLNPVAGAFLAAIIAAVILAETTGCQPGRIDTVLSGIWAGGFALGMILMVLATGEPGDMEEFLLGSVTNVTSGKILAMLVGDGILAVIFFIGYEKLLAIAFDRELAQLRGVNVALWEYVFYLMLALGVVMLVVVAGVVLAVTLLALPATVAGRMTHRLLPRMALSGIVALILSLAGYGLANVCGLPVAAMITVLAVLANLAGGLLCRQR